MKAKGTVDNMNVADQDHIRLGVTFQGEDQGVHGNINYLEERARLIGSKIIPGSIVDVKIEISPSKAPAAGSE